MAKREEAPASHSKAPLENGTLFAYRNYDMGNCRADVGTMMKRTNLAKLSGNHAVASCTALLLLVCSLPVSAATESAEAIRATVTRFVRNHLPANISNAQIHVDGPAPGLRFPACDHLQLGFFGYSNPYGNQTVTVSCSSPSPWKLYLPVRLAIKQNVVVAARPLSADRVLSAADLSVVQRDTNGLGGNALSDPQQAIGQVLRFGTLAGQPITTSMLNAPEVVRAGEQVTLYAEGDGIRIATIANAIENGRPGQAILVRNMQSGRVIRGTVTARGAVVVPF